MDNISYSNNITSVMLVDDTIIISIDIIILSSYTVIISDKLIINLPQSKL